MLVLSADNVRAALDPPAAVEAIERALWEETAGHVRVPGRVTFDVDHGWFRVMPGALLGDDGRAVMGVKVMALARGAGLSYLLLLYDERTGELLAMMDASVLTQVRTGAVSAAFLRRVCPGGVPMLGVIGSGFEARGQLETIARTIDVRRVCVFSPNAERRSAFAAEMTRELGIRVDTADTAKVAAAAPVVVLATRATAPVVDGAWFSEGAVIVSIGSTRPELREIDDRTIARAGRVIVDHRGQAMAESGDIQAGLAARVIQEDDIVELPAALRGGSTLRPASPRLLLFKPSGTAAQDLAVARLVYDCCLTAGTGQPLDGFLTRKPR